jgi:lauroyl/myristoyl acyltransferase
MGAPPPNSILVSVHHTCQFLAFVRLSRLLPDLGFVSTVSWENRPETVRAGLLLDLMDRSFGSRVYRPGQAARAGLAVLRGGGSLLLFSDFAASGVPTPLLGRRVPLARGPEWFAQQTGCPIIPVMVVPNRRGWALWCGEPVATTQDGIDACIRQAPASWLGWRDWFDASVVA